MEEGLVLGRERAPGTSVGGRAARPGRLEVVQPLGIVRKQHSVEQRPWVARDQSPVHLAEGDEPAGPVDPAPYEVTRRQTEGPELPHAARRCSRDAKRAASLSLWSRSGRGAMVRPHLQA